VDLVTLESPIVEEIEDLHPELAVGPDPGDRIESLRALLQTRADRLVAELNEELERRIAQTLQRSSDEFAEIMRRLAEGRDAVSALFAGSSRPPQQPLAAGPAAPAAHRDAGEGTAALRRELGELSRGGSAPSV
jgi:hypothetical protein